MKTGTGYLLILLLLGIILFWLFRVAYWENTYELPFSDMADYDAIAHRILQEWDFSHSDFWQSYQPPVLPMLRAIQILLLGESLRGWQVFQTVFLFLALLWLVFEVAHATKRLWLGLALLWIVALSKPSIFWSLKIATEGIAEAFLYLCAAAMIRALRKRSKTMFLISGCVCTLAALNKPNFFVVVPLFIAGFITTSCIRFYQSKEGKGKLLLKDLWLALVFLVGLAFTWSPWLVRSYQLYGHVVPFNTHGGYTFLWELQDVSSLQGEATKKFKNDYEAYANSKELISQWLKQHWREYPRIVVRRFVRVVTDRTIYLTKVSRADLFPGYLNDILIDKTPWLIMLGGFGLIFSILYHPIFYILTAISLGAWIAGSLALGFPRMLEPMIPTILFGNMFWLIAFGKAARKLASRKQVVS